MRAHRIAIVVALNGVLAACGAKDVVRDSSPADVLVSVRGGTITAPAVVRPGWTRVRVEEDGGGHIVVIFRLPTTASDADVASFLAALDTTPTTPSPGVAMATPRSAIPAPSSFA
jgi:hypothetical protein